MEDLLALVTKSLHDRADKPTHDTMTIAVPEHRGDIAPEVYEEAEQEIWEYDANQMDFDDTGEGVGVEGDLDVDDD